MPDTRYSSTSSDLVRERHRQDLGVLARRERAETVIQAQRAGADERGALDEPARRHARRQPPHLLQLGEQVQIAHRRPGCRCRSRPARPTGRTARSAARPRPPTGCCAGTSPGSPRARAAAPGCPRRAARRARPASARRSRPGRSRYSTGPRPGATQSSRQAPIRRSRCAHGPLPEASSSISSRRFTDVDARDGLGAAGDLVPDGLEQLARHRVRRMRRHR